MGERNGCACCLCISLSGVVLAALRVGAMAGSPVSPQRPVLLATRQVAPPLLHPRSNTGREWHVGFARRYNGKILTQ